MPRLKNRDILPAAIGSRYLSNFIFGSAEAQASTATSNGTQSTLTLNLNQPDGYELLGIVYTAIYVGSVSDANQLPSGSNIDETQWTVIGPFYDFDNWEDDPNFNGQFAFARQREYAKQLNLESIYTPQLIINGGYELVGSSRSAAEARRKAADGNY